MLNVLSCLEQEDQFDIIHNHNDVEGVAMARLMKTPVLTTLHNNLQGDSLLLFTRYQGWTTLSVSRPSPYS